MLTFCPHTLSHGDFLFSATMLVLIQMNLLLACLRVVDIYFPWENSPLQHQSYVVYFGTDDLPEMITFISAVDILLLCCFFKKISGKHCGMLTRWHLWILAAGILT